MNYTFNKIKNIDYDDLVSLYKKREPDIFSLTHKNISLHSPFNDILFIYKYISTCLTKYEVYLENDDKFKTREDVKKYVDIVSTLSSSTIKFYVENNFDLSETIIYFVKQFLSFIFKNTKFLVINIASIDNVNLNTLTKFKLIIEPIIESEKNRVDYSNEVFFNKVADMFFLFTSFLENEESSVSSTLIKSKYWIKDYDKFPTLIDDGMYLNLFEKEPELYKRVFEIRDTILRDDFDLINDDINTINELSYNENIIFNSDPFSEDEEEFNLFLENRRINDEAKNLGMYIDVLYSKIFSTSFKKTDIDSVRFNTPELPMYVRVNLEKDSSKIFYDYLKKIFNEVYKKRKPVNVKDMSLILPPVEYKSSVDGYKKFIYDNHDNKTINNVKEFMFYVSENIKDYISLSSKTIDAEFFSKLINSYKKTDVEVKNINSLGDKIKLECSLDGQNYRFTFSEKSGIIDSIEYKEG